MGESHDYCCVQMPNEENKILEYKENQKPKKATFVIYSDLECLLEKTNDNEDKQTINNEDKQTTIINNEDKQTTTINNHTPSGYSIYTQCSLDGNKNKLGHYRGKDCIEKFTDHLKEHATSILDCKQKKQ